MNKPTEQKPPVRSDKEKESHNELVISFLSLRNLIGISGMLLPIVLATFTPKGENDKVLEHSISEYFYTKNGDLFVVFMCVIGVFLVTYKGYNRFWERTLTFVSGICAMGVGFFPTATSMGNSLSIHKVRNTVPQFFGLVQWHFVFAALFFILLAIISLVYFQKKDKTGLPPVNKKQKERRNIIYKIAGWTMLACVALMIIYFKTEPAWLADKPVVFILETIAVEAFGISWMTKGQTFYPDGEHYIKRGLREAKQMIQEKAAS